jgi:hypothetical protein
MLVSKARLDALFAVLCRALMETSLGAKRIGIYEKRKNCEFAMHGAG